jgi:hypothetical protein
MTLHRTLFCAALLAASAIVSPAHAQFTGSNTAGGDGYLQQVDTDVWALVGADNGAASNITLATATSAIAQSLTFNYIYASYDASAAYDPAGYFINGDYTQLTLDEDQFRQGMVTFNLNAGDSYGFYIYTTDGCCGPGFLLFGAAPAPEPASWAMMVGGFGLIGGAMRSRRRTAIRFG